MTSIFNFNNNDDDDEYIDKIDLDELYEKKKLNDLQKLNIYKNILSRVHNRIRVTSRQSKDNLCCWYVIPEMIIGVPKYDQGHCIAFLLDKLQENGFVVRYTHPNLLFISWNHWVPSYVRSEIKKKTGMNIDGYGNLINKQGKSNNQNDSNQNNNTFDNNNSNDPNSLLLNMNKTNNINNNKPEKQYKSIRTYQPTGKLIYNNDVVDPFIKDK